MLYMQWFNIARVKKNPSQQEKLPPDSKPVERLYNNVLTQEDQAFFRLLDYHSRLDVYIRPTHFIVRQYAIQPRTEEQFLFAEYTLTLTEDAQRIVDALINSPFECSIKQWTDIYYCNTVYPVYIPDYDTPSPNRVFLSAMIDIFRLRDKNLKLQPISNVLTNLPSNHGPFYLIWKRAVECWVNELVKKESELNKGGSIDVRKLKRKLLEHKYFNREVLGALFKYLI